MGRRKNKPVTIDRWDMGAKGPANRANLKEEPRGETDPNTGKKINPNGVKGMRRVDMIEIWYQKGRLSTAGYNAAEKLRDAYEGTQRGAGWSDNDKVQSQIRPDVVVTAQIDRLSKFHEVSKRIHPNDKEIIEACVLDGHTPAVVGFRGRNYQAGIDELRDALDRLSQNLDRK